MPESPKVKYRLMGVILCGGRSARMGRDKAGLPHPSGGTFQQHAIDRLQSVCDQVCLSVGPAAANEPAPKELLLVGTKVVRVCDPVAHQGPMIGVVRCLEQAASRGFDACLVTPVDMPDLTSHHLRMIRDAWYQSHGYQSHGLVCAIDEDSQQLEPLVAIYPLECAAALARASQSQDRSLSRWLQGHHPVLVKLPAGACRNVNRPSDLGP